jgi:hypothetical protein
MPIDDGGQTKPVGTGEGLTGLPVLGNTPLLGSGEGLIGLPVVGSTPLLGNGEELIGLVVVVVGNVTPPTVTGLNGSGVFAIVVPVIVPVVPEVVTVLAVGMELRVEVEVGVVVEVEVGVVVVVVVVVVVTGRLPMSFAAVVRTEFSTVSSMFGVRDVVPVVLKSPAVMRALFTALSCGVARSEVSAEATAGEATEASPVREPLDRTELTSEATVAELGAVLLVVVPELKSDRIVSSREASEVGPLVVVVVVVEVGVVVVLALEVVDVGVANTSRSDTPAGNCVMFPVVKVIGAPDTKTDGPAAVAAELKVVGSAFVDAVTTGSLAAAACMLACVLASAVSCFCRTLTDVPAWIRWTHRVTCCWVGAVWRIDSNIAVTRWPARVSARSATAWAEPPAAERSVRSSRADADPEIDGTNRRCRRRDGPARPTVISDAPTIVVPPQGGVGSPPSFIRAGKRSPATIGPPPDSGADVLR